MVIKISSKTKAKWSEKTIMVIRITRSEYEALSKCRLIFLREQNCLFLGVLA